MRTTNKYKDRYKIVRPKDNNSKYTKNPDDNFIPCNAKGQIYRYNKDTLVVLFNTIKYSNNRIADLSTIGVCLTPFQTGDQESTYKFKENDFKKVAKICKAKKIVKRELTEEEKEVLRKRMNDARKMIGKST